MTHKLSLKKKPIHNFVIIEHCRKKKKKKIHSVNNFASSKLSKKVEYTPHPPCEFYSIIIDNEKILFYLCYCQDLT